VKERNPWDPRRSRRRKIFLDSERYCCLSAQPVPLRSNSAKAQMIWNMSLAGRRGRVDRLLIQGGIDAACCERLHGAEQIDQRPPKPIDDPSSLDCAIGNAAFIGTLLDVVRFVRPTLVAWRPSRAYSAVRPRPAQHRLGAVPDDKGWEPPPKGGWAAVFPPTGDPRYEKSNPHLANDSVADLLTGVIDLLTGVVELTTLRRDPELQA
jgi:hypothetical protein